MTGPDGYSLCVLNNVNESVIVVNQGDVAIKLYRLINSVHTDKELS